MINNLKLLSWKFKLSMLFLIVITSSLYSQKLELGAYVGGNISNWTSGPSFSSKRIVGYNIGIVLENKLTKRLSLNSRIENSLVGGKNFNGFRRNDGFSNDEDIITANYIGGKIDLRHYLGNNVNKFFYQIGVGGNYALSANRNGNTFKNNLKSLLDFQTQLGVGKKFSLSNGKKLELIMEYLRGWNKIVPVNSQSGMNQSFSLKLAYKILM